MNQKLKITGIGALALTAIGCVDQPKDQRPNIIFVLADDIGAEAFGCYGGVSYETPNIDELRPGKVSFTATCIPCRSVAPVVYKR